MRHRDDQTIQRRRQLETLDAIADRRPRAPAGPGVMVGIVFDDGAMPTTVPSFFSVHPVEVGGAEAEGQPGTLSASNDSVVVLVTDHVPKVGDYLVCRRPGARWVAEVGCGTGPSTIACGGCPDVPETLHGTYVNAATGENTPYQFNFLDGATPASPSWISYPTGATGWTRVLVLGCGKAFFSIQPYFLKDGTPYPTTNEQLVADINDGTATAGILWPGAAPSSCSPLLVVISSGEQQLTVTP